jgi:ABC-type arginine transport system ATPase subunit
MREKMLAQSDSITKKEFAKTAMTVAIGVTVLTAPFLKRNRAMKNLHASAGLLLAGFTLWHHLLYQQPKKKANIPKKAAELPNKQGSLNAEEIKMANV